MKRKRVYYGVLIASFLLIQKPGISMGDQPLAAEKIKNLHEISQALLASRAIEKKKLEKEIIEDCEVLEELKNTLRTLEADLRREFIKVSTTTESESMVSSSSSVKRVQQEEISIRLDPKSMNSVVERHAPPASASQQKTKTQSSSAASETIAEQQGASINVSTARTQASKKMDQAFERSLSRMETLRSKIEKTTTETQPSREGMLAEVQSKLKRKARVLATIEAVENELGLMRKTAPDLRKLKALQERLKLKDQGKWPENIEPTLTTLTKHRR